MVKGSSTATATATATAAAAATATATATAAAAAAATAFAAAAAAATATATATATDRKKMRENRYSLSKHFISYVTVLRFYLNVPLSNVRFSIGLSLFHPAVTVILKHRDYMIHIESKLAMPGHYTL
jgi:hypothetical protein